MNNNLKWLEEHGISLEDGFAYTGGEKQYISVLQRYFRGYEANRRDVEDFLSEGDLDGYTIKVHALKSNSKMIGAAALSSAFEALEMAAKNGEVDFLTSSTQPTLEQYKELIELIRPIGEAEAVHAPGEISGEEAKKTADSLLAALDNFDDEKSGELVKKLSGYPFRPTQKGKLGEAVKYIENFLYDEAAGLIREIYTSIE